MSPLPHARGERQWRGHRLEWWTGSWFRNAAPWTNHPHRHRGYHELCLVSHGAGRFDHGDRWWRLRPGSLFVSDLDVVHEISCRERGSLALAFVCFRIERLAAQPGSDPGDRLCDRFLRRHRICVDAPQLLDWLRVLTAPAASGGDGLRAAQAVEGWLLEGLAALAPGDGRGGTRHAAGDDAVEAALRHLERHLEAAPTVVDLAAAAGVGERQLRRLFKERLGTGVVEAVNRHRVDQACRLLAMRLPVAEVARRVGVATPSAFSRLFGERMGRSPRRWQQEHAPRPVPRQTHFAPGLEPAAQPATSRAMAEIVMYEYAGCGTCRKARAWLAERGIEPELRPIRERPPTRAELERAWAAVGGEARKLFNTAGRDYREGGWKDRIGEATKAELLRALRANGNLIKRPLLLVDDACAVGFKPDEWSALLPG